MRASPKYRAGAALALLAGALSLGCGEKAYTEHRLPLRAFRVTIPSGTQIGKADAPLPFPSAVPAAIALEIEAVDSAGLRLKDFNGIAVVSVSPGQIDATQRRVQFKDGVAVNPTDPNRPPTVDVRFAYGDTHIWIEDIGEDVLTECDNGLDDDGDQLKDAADPDCQIASGPASAKSTLATGISPSLFFAEPRIHDLQYSPRCTTDTPLGGQNVTIRNGTLITTGTTQSGMYVTDLDGPPDGYNSVFLFTFSNPGGVRIGDRLCSIAGNAAEFIANSQLNFPSFENGREDPQHVVEGQTIKPCNPTQPERVGIEALPEPHVIVAADVTGTSAVVPDDFYRVCGPGDTPIAGLDDPTDCAAASQATRNVPRNEQKIDCKRDNFAMEAWEHGLVAVENVTIGDRFADCDLNGDGSIQRGASDTLGEDACDKACNEDPLCTSELSLEQYGQFAAGLDCAAGATPGDADAGVPAAGDTDAALPPAQCAAKIYISTRDTLGKSGYDVKKHAGEKVARIVGHLRQTQPGAGIQTIWVVEPRSPEDFVSGVSP